VFWEFFQQHPAQHGLAAADFTADLDDAFDFGNRVDQRVKNLAAIGPGKKEYRNGSNPEWRFCESEVL
jgi:hypothetical protein